MSAHGTPESRSAAALRILQLLAAGGPMLSTEVRSRLGLGARTMAHAMSQIRGDLVTVGQTRALTLAARRAIPGLPPVLPLYELGREVRCVAHLHPVHPAGFFVESDLPIAGFHPDLPWFMFELRPAGFLGCFVPRQHPELALPSDILLWTGDHVLRWLHEWGVDTPGAFVVGDVALARSGANAPRRVDAAERESAYPRLAEIALAAGIPGSSAGGEQPKFLATRIDDGRPTPVLVKFSPRVVDLGTRRAADVLRCEHHALESLRSRAIAAARSTLLQSFGRVFLEVERFDRDGDVRLGMISLLAVAAHHGASLESWSAAADALLAAGVIGVEDHARIHVLDRFGALVGNADRHAGNLSFFLSEGSVGSLAPAYDMAPMAYAIRAGEFATPVLVPPVPTPHLPRAWRAAWAAAEDTWSRVAGDAAIAPDLREAGAANVAALGEGRAWLGRLPA